MKKMILVAILAIFATATGSKAQSINYKFYTQISLGWVNGVSGSTGIGIDLKHFDIDLNGGLQKAELVDVRSGKDINTIGVGISVRGAYNLSLGKGFEFSPFVSAGFVVANEAYNQETTANLGVGLELSKRINEDIKIYVSGAYKTDCPSFMAGAMFRIN